MKLIYSFIILLSTISSPLAGQIGINTERPVSNSILHIDPKRNNASVPNLTPTVTDDDIVVTSDGKVGIGTVSPQAKLHIESQNTGSILRIDDGSQQVNRILYTDNTGKGLWKDYTSIALVGKFSSTNTSIPHTTTSFVDTGITLELLPGRWLVLITIIFDVTSTGTIERAWFDGTFADATTLTSLSPSLDIEDYSTSAEKRYFSGLVWLGGIGNLVANLTINNNANSTKKYNLLFGRISYSGGIPFTVQIGQPNDFSNIIAFRIK